MKKEVIKKTLKKVTDTMGYVAIGIGTCIMVPIVFGVELGKSIETHSNSNSNYSRYNGGYCKDADKQETVRQFLNSDLAKSMSADEIEEVISKIDWM